MLADGFKSFLRNWFPFIFPSQEYRLPRKRRNRLLVISLLSSLSWSTSSVSATNAPHFLPMIMRFLRVTAATTGEVGSGDVCESIIRRIHSWQVTEYKIHHKGSDEPIHCRIIRLHVLVLYCWLTMQNLFPTTFGQLTTALSPTCKSVCPSKLLKATCVVSVHAFWIHVCGWYNYYTFHHDYTF